LSADGVGAGETHVMLDVQGPAHRVSGRIDMDNEGMPATGVGRAGIGIQTSSLLVSADALAANFNVSSKGNTTGLLDWNLPLGNSDWRLDTQYLRSQFSVPASASANVSGTADTVTAGLVYPIVLNFKQVINLQIDAGYTLSRAEIGSGSPFQNRTIYTGDVQLNGNNGLQAVSQGQFWYLWNGKLTYGHVSDSATGASAADAVGPGMLNDFLRMNASLNGRITPASLPLVIGYNLRAQASSRNLDPSQQLGIGGPGGVRAYPLDEGGFDEGGIATFDAHHDFHLGSGFQLTC